MASSSLLVLDKFHIIHLQNDYFNNIIIKM